MNLNNFSEHIASSLLTKGKAYFEDGLVDHLEELQDGVWSAEVEGTELYYIAVVAYANEIGKTECTCPYFEDNGLCKHIVAVLFALQKKMIFTKQPEKKKSSTVGDRIDVVLDRLDQEDLKDFLKKILLKDRERRTSFFLQFEYQGREIDLSDYQHIIEESLHYASYKGYIDYYSVGKSLEGAKHVLNTVHMKDFSPCEVIDIMVLLINTVTPYLAQTDDSSGIMGMVLEEAYEMMKRELHEVLLLGEERKKIFNIFLYEGKNPIFQDWDFQWYWFEMAAQLIVDDAEYKELQMAMASSESAKNLTHDWQISYYDDRQCTILVDVLKRIARQEEVITFYQEHLFSKKMWLEYVQVLFAEKQFEKIHSLLVQAVQDKKSVEVFAIRRDFYEVGVRLAREERNVLEERRYLLLLYEEREAEEYYSDYKHTFSMEEWSSGARELFLKKYEKKTSPHLLAKIYEKEEMYSMLLTLLCDKKNMVEILAYVHVFEHHQDKGLLFLAATSCIKKELASQIGRSIYRGVAEWFLALKPCFPLEVTILKEEILGMYSNRPALREELKRVS